MPMPDKMTRELKAILSDCQKSDLRNSDIRFDKMSKRPRTYDHKVRPYFDPVTRTDKNMTLTAVNEIQFGLSEDLIKAILESESDVYAVVYSTDDDNDASQLTVEEVIENGDRIKGISFVQTDYKKLGKFFQDPLIKTGGAYIKIVCAEVGHGQHLLTGLIDWMKLDGTIRYVELDALGPKVADIYSRLGFQYASTINGAGEDIEWPTDNPWALEYDVVDILREAMTNRTTVYDHGLYSLYMLEVEIENTRHNIRTMTKSNTGGVPTSETNLLEKQLIERTQLNAFIASWDPITRDTAKMFLDMVDLGDDNRAASLHLSELTDPFSSSRSLRRKSRSKT